MRARLLASAAFAIAVSASLASVSHAQANDSSATQPAFTPQFKLESPAASPTVLRYQSVVDRKDPAVAGVLSLVVPGLGSFYAGNTSHGVIHLAVHVGSYAAFVGGAMSGDGGSAALGYVVLLGNDIWSIFTAVNDANAHNGTSPTSGRIVGSLYLRPDIRVSDAPRDSGTRAMSGGLQLIQLRF